MAVYKVVFTFCVRFAEESFDVGDYEASISGFSVRRGLSSDGVNLELLFDRQPLELLVRG